MMNLSNFNLNLLFPFCVLVQEKHISRAAKKLNISQSATSKLLSQLREAFNNPLLVRTSKGMEPTEYALKLYKKVLPIIKETENLFFLKQEFNPKDFNRNIKIGMPAMIADSGILPLLYKELKKQAPNLQLEIISLDTKTLQQKINNDEIDMAITYFNQIPDTCKTTRLYTEHPVCLARRDHPMMKHKTITIQEYLKYEHIVLQYDTLSATFLVDFLLKKYKHEKRNVKLILQSPMSAFTLSTKSDMLLTITKTIANKYAKQFGLDYRPFSISLPEIAIHLIWAPLYNENPWHQWVRNVIKTVLGQVPHL